MLILRLKEMPYVITMVTVFWRKMWCEKSMMCTYTLVEFHRDMITQMYYPRTEYVCENCFSVSD